MTASQRATQFQFTLPLGLSDAAGRVHRQGVMRLATALDEVEPLGDARVKDNEAFLGILLLSRVTLRLGDYTQVGPEMIAALFASDFAYLQSVYAAVNAPGQGPAPFAPAPFAALTAPAASLPSSLETVCPHCGTELILDLDSSTPPGFSEEAYRA